LVSCEGQICGSNEVTVRDSPGFRVTAIGAAGAAHVCPVETPAAVVTTPESANVRVRLS
jgi:hypothetical protein